MINYLSRSFARSWSAELPVGDPFGGAAFGHKNDPITATIGASAVSGGLGYLSAEKASKRAAAGAKSAIGEQRRQFDLTREDTRPYREVGSDAVYRLSQLYGLNTERPSLSEAEETELAGLRSQLEKQQGKPGLTLAPNSSGPTMRHQMGTAAGPAIQESLNQAQTKISDRIKELEAKISGAPQAEQVTPQQLLEQMPGYQFRMSEGQKALDRGQLASGAAGGRRIKEALRYNQDFASNEFGNAAEGLFRMSGLGGNAVNTSASAGANAANNIGSYRMSAANASGNAYMAGASAINNAIQGGVGNYVTISKYNDMMKMLQPGAA